ncbi:MAG: choice-of-anchor D domain-containing protein, partial [Gemmatimonadetes bacterium]
MNSMLRIALILSLFLFTLSQAQAAVHVSAVPNTYTVNTGDVFDVPLHVTDIFASDNYFSFEMDMAYRDSYVTIGENDVAPSAMLEGWSLTVLVRDGRLMVNGSGSTPLEGSGLFLTLTFTSVAEGTSTLDMNDFTFNDRDRASFDRPVATITATIPLGAQIAVTPTEHDFGNVRLGESATQTFTILNTGDAALTISNITIGGMDAAQFAITAGGDPATLPPAGSTETTIEFTPSAEQSYSAELQISSNDADNPTFYVPLTGTGAQVHTEIQVFIPDPVERSVDVGGTVNVPIHLSMVSALDEVIAFQMELTYNPTYLSLSPEDVQLGSILDGWSPIINTETPGVVTITGQNISTPLVGSGEFVTLTFTGLANGTSDLNIQEMTFNEGTPAASYTSPLGTVIVGTGIPDSGPQIVVTPSSWDYQTVRIGRTATKTFSISNAGDQTLTVSAQTLSGSQADQFAITAGGGPVVLEPGEIHLTSVQFAPTTEGVQTATLTISSNDPENGAFEVPLQGTGALGNPEITIFTPEPTQFDIAIGETASIPIHITQVDAIDEVIAFRLEFYYDASFLSITENDITMSELVSGWTLIINASQPDVIIIAGNAITPLEGSGLLATLQFTGAADGTSEFGLTSAQFNEGEPAATYDNPLATVVVGTGVALGLTISPTSLDFGSIEVGQTDTQTLTLSNEGVESITVTDQTFSGSHPDQFSIIAGGGSFTLLPGEDHQFTVQFAPTQPDLLTATLTISSDDPENPTLDVPVQGIGDQAHAFIDVFIPNGENLTVDVGGQVAVPVHVSRVSPLDGVLAFEMRLGYNADYLSITNNDVEFGTLLDGWFTQVNANTPGLVIANGFAINALEGEGELLTMTFTGLTDGVSELTFNPFVLNEGEPPVHYTNPVGQIIIGEGIPLIPEIDVSPTAGDFGTILEGETAEVVFTITNMGNTELSIYSQELSGADATEFAIIDGGGALTIPAGV